MSMLAALEDTELGALWWRLLEAMRDVHAELDLLTGCPPITRQALYGVGVVDAYIAMRDDIADLLKDVEATATPVAELRLGGRDSGLYVNGIKVD